MPVALETERQIRSALHHYCDYFDTAQFESFAGLFEHGRWFMVDQPGSRPVQDWINEHIVLYDGLPLTRHEVTNLVVDEGVTPDEAAFRCYVAIWQHLPSELPRLLAHARFRGTFDSLSRAWHWREHRMSVDYAGDLSTHIKGGIASVT